MIGTNAPPPLLGRAVRHEWPLDWSFLTVNHGSFGATPRVVLAAQQDWRRQLEAQPTRFMHETLPAGLAAAAARLGAFLGADANDIGFVDNATSGCNAVLRSLHIAPNDEILVLSHGYGAVRKALSHHAARAGARVVEAAFPVGAEDDEIARAYAGVCSPRTRLVVIDAITSPTATVVPVAAVAAAVRAVNADALVLVDAAHAPGQLRDDIAALGADHWVGNLHKWAYTPRGSAILWSRPGAEVAPTVLSWGLEDGYAESFDFPGTWDYAGWLAVPDGLAYWEALGGWDAVARLSSLVTEGQKRVAEALGVTLERLPVTPAPAMRLVPLPDGVLTAPDQVASFYEALSRRRVEVAPVRFDGVGYLRIAAAPYNTADDYDRLAGTVRELLG